VESGGTLSFSRAPWTAATELSDTGLQSVYGRIDLTTSGTTQVASGANATLRSASSPGQLARINWNGQGPVTVAADSTLALYTTPYGADLLSEGAAAQLSGSLQLPTGATLASTSSGLTITAPIPGFLQLGGTLLVNAGTTTLNLGSTAQSTIGTVKLIDGSLALNGSSSPSAATSIGDLQLLGGTLSGSGSLAITQAFSRGAYSVLAPNAFSALSITQATGNLYPGALSVAGPLELEASSGALSLNAPVSAGSILGLGSTGLSIAAAASLTASDSSGLAIGLSSGNGAFVNGAGSSALSVAPGAYWQIYAASPLSTPIANLGGLAYAFKQYGKTPFDAEPIAGSGNGLFYAYKPSVSASLVGTPAVSKEYDGTTLANLVASNYSTTGNVDGDTVLLNNPATGSYDNRNAGVNKTVSVSAITLVSASEAATGVPVYGYSLSSTTASAPIGTITPAPITVAFTTPAALAGSLYTPVLNPGTGAASANPSLLIGQFQGVTAADAGKVALVVSDAPSGLEDAALQSESQASGGGGGPATPAPAAVLVGEEAGNYRVTAVTVTSGGTTTTYAVTQLPAAASSGSAATREQASGGVAQRLNLVLDAGQQQTLSAEQVQALLGQAMRSMQGGTP